MDETHSTEEPTIGRPRRPLILTVLCILTFIGSGMNFISSLRIGLFYDLFIKVSSEIAKTFEIPGMEMISQASPAFFIVSAVLYLVALAGAFEMWNLRRRGFHIYTVAQILSVIAPMYFLHLSGPSIFDLILSGTFVILYSTQLKNMS